MSGPRCRYSLFQLDASSPKGKTHMRSCSETIGTTWTLSAGVSASQVFAIDKRLASHAARISVAALEHLTIVVGAMPASPVVTRASQTLSDDGVATVSNSTIAADQSSESFFCLSEIVDALAEIFYPIAEKNDAKTYRTIAHKIGIIIAKYCPLKIHPLHSRLESMAQNARDSVSSVISLSFDTDSCSPETLVLDSDDSASCDSAINAQLIADQDDESFDDVMFPEQMIAIVCEILFQNIDNPLCGIIAAYFPPKLSSVLISAIQQAGDRGPISTETSTHAHSRFILLNDKNVSNSKIENQTDENPTVKATTLVA